MFDLLEERKNSYLFSENKIQVSYSEVFSESFFVLLLVNNNKLVAMGIKVFLVMKLIHF